MKYLPLDWRLNLGLMLATVILSLFLFSNNTRLQKRIATKEAEAAILKRQNQELENQRQQLQDSIHIYLSTVQKLNSVQEQLIQQKGQLEKKIKTINSKYEKAKTHANNFTTDSIRRYFSNFD
jgi:hypothetical protein